MPEVYEPIVRRKLSDEVLHRLQALITQGDLQPGDYLPSERELMGRFHVGRPAIREALQALNNMGLITISHGERARVRQLTARALFGAVDAAAKVMLSTSPDSIDHLKEARLFFERGMVRGAAIRATEADVAALREAVAEQRRRLGDSDRFMTADIAFHARIAAVSGNPIYEAVSEAMLGWLRTYHTALLIWTGKEATTLAEHDEIVRAIAAHDPDAAERAMIRHLERSAALYVHQPPG